MKRLVITVCSIAAVVILIGAVFVVLNVARFGITRPTLYEFTVGYRGWFYVSYADSKCSPASRSWLFQVIRIEGDGHGCTSSSAPAGWHYQRAVYVDTQGRRTSAPPVWPLGYSATRKLVIAFVGTEKEFRTSPQPPLR